MRNRALLRRHNYSVLGAEETAKRMGDSASILKKHYANPRVTRAELARYHSTKEMDPAKVLGNLIGKAA